MKSAIIYKGPSLLDGQPIVVIAMDPNRKIAKGRKCYVNLGQGVLIVFKSFLRGVYKEGDPPKWGAVVSYASERTGIPPQYRNECGNYYFRTRTDSQPTHTKNHGVQRLQCRARTATPRP